MYINWNDELNLDNDLIDTQHRMLMLLCRKLDIAIKTRQSDQTLRWVMLEVKKFVEFHFLSEENLMHEINYPDVDKHALIHAELLLQIEMMLAKISHHQEFPEDLLFFLNTWLVGHIVHEDMRIAEYAKSAELRPIGESLYQQYLLKTAD